VLAPPEVPLHRTRAQQFDDLVLQAVTRLEARWEDELAGVEFAVEEIPPAAALADGPGAGPVPLGRLDAGQARGSAAPADGAPPREVVARPGGPAPRPRPPRIVVYRRPVMARAEGEEELGELVYGVVVIEFARLLGLDPEDVDPEYPGAD
jgi:predicted Zn-dependent protease with MMP-like domain